MVIVFAMFFRQISEWRNKRREKKGKSEPSKRETRARHIWGKYGLPVFSLLSPTLIGTDLSCFNSSFSEHLTPADKHTYYRSIVLNLVPPCPNPNINVIYRKRKEKKKCHFRQDLPSLFS